MAGPWLVLVHPGRFGGSGVDPGGFKMFKTSGAIRGDPGKMLVRGSFGLVRGSSVARPVCSGLVRGSFGVIRGSSVGEPWQIRG